MKTVKEDHNQSKFKAVELSPNGYIYGTAPRPMAQETLQITWQNDPKGHKSGNTL